MSFGEYTELLSTLNGINSAMVSLCAFGLLAVFVINCLIADQKWLQIKAELHKLIAAVMILVPALISLVPAILITFVLSRMGTDAYVAVNQIFGIGSFAIELLMTVVFAVLVLVLGLIFKKPPAQTAVPAQPDPAPVLQMDLPVGVDPNSLDI